MFTSMGCLRENTRNVSACHNIKPPRRQAEIQIRQAGIQENSRSGFLAFLIKSWRPRRLGGFYFMQSKTKGRVIADAPHIIADVIIYAAAALQLPRSG